MDTKERTCKWCELFDCADIVEELGRQAEQEEAEDIARRKAKALQAKQKRKAAVSGKLGNKNREK